MNAPIKIIRYQIITSFFISSTLLMIHFSKAYPCLTPQPLCAPTTIFTNLTNFVGGLAKLDTFFAAAAVFIFSPSVHRGVFAQTKYAPSRF